MEPLLEFYKSVLSFAGLEVDENGFVHARGGDTPVITVGDKVMVIPTRNHLEKLATDKEYFHPLTEDPMVAMPKYLDVYAYRLNGALNVRFAELVIELYNLANSPARSAEMLENPVRLEILKNVVGTEPTEKKTQEFLNFIVAQMKSKVSGAFLQITAGRGAIYKGRKQSRVGFTSFKLYTEVKKDITLLRKDVTHKNLSKENGEMFVQLYEAIFPGLDNAEEYNYGFESGPYPFFSTYLCTALKLAENLNRILEAFRDVMGSDLDPLDLSWYAAFEDKANLGRLAKMVPRLDGSVNLIDPKRLEDPTVDKEVKPTAVPVAVPTQVVASSQPANAPKPTTPAGRQRVEMKEWLSANGAPSAMGQAGTAMEVRRRHNEGYAIWYADFMSKNNGVGPAGMPHPSQVQGLAPFYQGCDPRVLQFGNPQYVQQPQLVYNAQGQPIGYAPPPQQQQQWGNGWGTPQQQWGNNGGWNTPQQQWGNNNQGGWRSQGFSNGNNNGWNNQQNTHSGQVLEGVV